MYCIYPQYTPSVWCYSHTLFWYRNTHMTFPPPDTVSLRDAIKQYHVHDRREYRIYYNYQNIQWTTQAATQIMHEFFFINFYSILIFLSASLFLVFESSTLQQGIYELYFLYILHQFNIQNIFFYFCKSYLFESCCLFEIYSLVYAD